MTEDITLFKQGLVASSEQSAQPELAGHLLNKIDKGWSEQLKMERTLRSIEHISQHIPSFNSAKVAAKPLFGAQQIPGDDATLRAANVSFEGKRYARCEIVKASSVLNAADIIVEQLIATNLFAENITKIRSFPSGQSITEQAITKRAEQLTRERNYPDSLADITTCKSL